MSKFFRVGMKHKLLILLLCVSLGVMADDRIDPLYVQLYAGLNKSANEHLPLSEFSRYPFSFGMFAGVGREVSPLWGWRGALRYNHNKSRNVAKCESAATWGWNSLELFGDATFDITDAIGRKRRSHDADRVFNLKAFAGIGAAVTFGFDDVPLSYTEEYSHNGSLVPALRVGLTATCLVADNWRLGIELSQTAFADNFNGVVSSTPIDTRSNLKVGVAYLFGDKRRGVVAREPVVLDRRLRVVPALPFVLPKREVSKQRKVSGRAFLDFPVNETAIYKNYRRNPQELRRICKTIDSALFDNTIRVTSISLHGYASPESSYANNTRLAKGRTAALMEFLQHRYHISASLFYNESTPEDWHNLREFIATDGRRRIKGDIWYESGSVLDTPEAPACVVDNREELLRIVDLDIDADEKELMLQRVAGGEPYKWLLKNVYPGLRHTDYVIEYVVRNYPLKQSRRIIYTHPEALSVEEMYRVAQSYDEGADEWFDALTIAARQYPDNPIANLNAACACVKARRLTDARHFLLNAGDTKQAQYLADIIKAMEGSVSWRLENGRLIIDKDFR